MTLTEEQRRAVKAGPKVCITACAGAGKSTVLVERIADQIEHGQDASKVIAITFTRKAAQELKRRLMLRGIKIGYVGTVHSWAISLLNTLSSVRLLAAPAALFEHMTQQEMFIAHMKKGDPMMPYIIRKVRSQLLADNLIDFDGILAELQMKILKGDITSEGMSLFVDEFQDTGPDEKGIYESLAPAKLTIVGDKDQCLYEFRGADPNSMAKVQSRFQMDQVELTKNFRCSGEIDQYGKSIRDGGAFVISESDPDGIIKTIEVVIDHVKHSGNGGESVTILCGYNRTVDQISGLLEAAGIRVAGESNQAYRNKLEAYCRWKACPDSEMLFRHALGLVNWYALDLLSKKHSESLSGIFELFGQEQEDEWFMVQQRAVDLLQLDYPDATIEELADVAAMPMESTAEGIKVMTVHAAKGLEWDNVVFVDDLRFTPQTRRMRYVAITRARNSITHLVLKERYDG